MSNPPNYFEDLDDVTFRQEEDGKYDDNETFGDSGPLNNEWENNHNLLSEEHEQYLAQNNLRKVNSFGDEDVDEDDEEDDEQFNNHHHHHHNNGFNSITTTSTTTTQFSQSSRKVTGVFSSLNQDDDSTNQIDEESVFKIAMGESTFEHHKHVHHHHHQHKHTTTNITPTKTTEDLSFNPLLKLMSQLPITTPDDSVDHEALKNRFSVSDLEAKYNNSNNNDNIQQQYDEQQLITPQKLNKPTDNIQNESPNKQQESPSKQQFYKNKYSRPPPITLGDMVPGSNNQQQQQQQQHQQQQQQSSPSQQQRKQHHQQQSQLSPRNNKYQNKYKNQQNNSGNGMGDKKYMTAEEIQTINRLQSYQIHFTNPYIEDYYYQRFKMKTSIPTHSHTPICDSQPKPFIQVKKPSQTGNTNNNNNNTSGNSGTTSINDPLSGALGRIPTHSIRAPRQILQVILNSGENGSEQSLSGSSSGSGGSNSDQTIKLVVESSYSHVLDLEDINILISLTQDEQLLQEYHQKRETVSSALFASLHLDPFPSFKFESPTLPPQDPNQKWPSVCPEDLLFVSLWVIAKGRKLLRRAFPLLSEKQSLSGLFAICRNLPLLLLLHLPEGSGPSTEQIYQQVVKWIMDVPIKFFILGFHFLVNFNQGKFIVKLLDTKEGRSIVHAFLARGILLHDVNYLAKTGFILEPIDNEQWRDVFDRFFLRLSNNFITVFPPTNNPSMELSQLFSLIFGNSNEKQRQIIQKELGSQ